MTPLDRRDRRRAKALLLSLWPSVPKSAEGEYIVKIAAALKREREEDWDAPFHRCPCRLCLEARRAGR